MSRKKIVALVVLGVLILSVIGLLVVTPSASLGPAFEGGGDAIALIRLSGAIQEGAGGGLLGGPAITPAVVRERLDQALNDPRVAAVIIRIDSPGGSVAASQEIASMVADFPLPIVISMADLAASGGYYVSAPADRIVAHPGTLTGSIGVIWTAYDIEGLLEKLGIELEVIAEGEHKDMFVTGDLSPEERRIVEEITGIMYGQFISEVAQGRGLPEDQVRELATGQLYTGSQAQELGLVDRLGGLEAAIEEAEGLAGIEDAFIVEYTPGFFELFLSGPGLAGRLFGPSGEIPVVNELSLLRQLLETHAVPRYGGGP